MTNVNDIAESIAALSSEERNLLLQARETREAGDSTAAGEPIAVVGIGCRFPGDARSPANFWRMLENGVSGITEVPPERWDIESYFDPDPDAPGRMSTRWGGFLGDVAGFDAHFFGIAPREAVHVDPQQRLLLEVAWESLEDAGLPPGRLRGDSVGVFVGICTSDYLHTQIRRNDPAAVGAYFGTGTALSIAAGRLSHFLGVQGPSISIDTACSSSLVAVHLACQSLRSGESSVALAGGVNVMLSPEITINFSKARMMAADGRCKTFDASADGYVRGEGCGLVVLRPLREALAAGNCIRAVIRGSAVNHDGRSAGLTVPNGTAQRALLKRVLKQARVSPSEVQYVEAHGTGTSLGDPIELGALADVFQADRTAQPLTVGSVKTNIGHLEAAAGIAGLIKVVLALQHGAIPPHLHFRKLNPNVSAAARELSIPVGRREWTTAPRCRAAGVSSFGFGGTNAHVLLGAGPEVDEEPAGQGAAELLALSAQTPAALDRLAAAWALTLRDLPPRDWASACFTSTVGRAHFGHRLAVVAATPGEAATQLETRLPEPALLAGTRNTELPPVCFLFSGQGCVYPGMGRVLYDTQPVFRAALERCDKWLRDHGEGSLLDRVYDVSAAEKELTATAWAQPALFSLEYALVEMWRSLGVEPAAVLGHSVGEFAAAWSAGAVGFEEALGLVVERGRLIQELASAGAMATVQAGRGVVAEAIRGIDEDVVVSAVNGPDVTTISGTTSGITAAVKVFRARKVATRLLDVSHAFHSPSMDPVLDALEASAGRMRCRPPRVPWISTLTGKPVEADKLPDAGYWRRQLREPVQFERAVLSLVAQRRPLFLELGPTRTLASLARRMCSNDGVFLSSLMRGLDDWTTVLGAVAQLYAQGIDPEWARVGRGSARRTMPMPTYPFERRKYWIQCEAKSAPELGSAQSVHPLLGRLDRTPGGAAASVDLQTVIATDGASMLAGHRIDGVVVLPGAALVEMILAGASALLGQGAARLQGLAFNRMLTSSGEDPLRLHIRIERAGAGRARVEMRRIDSGTPGRRVPDATGTVERLDSEHPRRPTDVDAVRNRCRTVVAGQDFYTRLRRSGFDYGGAFRVVQEVAIGDGEALGRVELRTPDTDPYLVHPVILDGCIQVCAEVLPDDWRGPSARGGALPIRIDEIRLQPDLPTRLRSHARLRSGSSANQAVVDIALLDGSHTVGYLRGLRFSRRRVPGSRAAVATYEVEWRSRTTPSRETRRSKAELAVVVAEDADVGNAFVAGFAEEGRPAVASRLDCGFVRLPLGEADLQGTVDIVYVPPSGHGVEACDGLRRVVEALEGLGTRLRLVVVTRRGQAVEDSDEVVDPAHSAVWGFGRTLALERPELRLLLIDTAVEEGQERKVARLPIHTVAEQEVALRGDRFLVPRLVARKRQVVKVDLSGDGTYIVTGGFGALGARAAEELVALGARNIVLGGRTVHRAVEDRIAALGVRLMAVSVDVTREEEVKRLREHLQADGWPEVHGIVHAAGELVDRTVGSLDRHLLRRAIAPKADGVRHLEAAFGAGPLRFFVVFSSAATLGAPGQAAYAAANAALDGWACGRRRRGKPALSVAWAGWRGLGMAVRADPSTPTLRAADALETFRDLLGCAAGHVVVLPAGMTTDARSSGIALLADLRRGERAPATDSARIAPLEPPSERARLRTLVRKQAAAVLRMESDAVDINRPLTDLGLDSLMALELRNGIIGSLGIALPLARILENPTVESIASEVLADLEADASDAPLPEVESGASGEFPLSRGQMAMWFLHKLAPDSTAYYLGDAVRIDGELDTSALRRAFRALGRRHEALRTTIAVDGHDIRQRVHPEVSDAGFELRECPDDDVKRVVDRLRREMERPVDPESGPLTRILVVTRRQNEHYLLLKMHHIVGELQSLILLVKELSRLYRAEVDGTPAGLGDIPGSYAGFVAHEQRLLAGAEAERLASYWARQLTPLPVPVTLTRARSRPSTRTDEGALHAFSLDGKSARALKRLARKENTTLFSTLLAVFLVLLHRESGQTDLVVGSPMTGRTRPEWVNTVGFFDNPVPLRVDVGGQPTFDEVLRRTRTTVLEAFDHQAYPLSMIVERLRPPRVPSRSPLFDVMFVLRKSSVADMQPLTQMAMGGAGAALDLGMGVRAESLNLGRRISQLDLTLAVTEVGEEFLASWEYRTDLFDAAAIESLTGHFLTLMRAAAAAPDTCIDKLTMITEAERRIALGRWNATSASLPSAGLLHAGFEEHAASVPDALAVVTPSARMTYGEVQQASNATAGWLRQRGVGADEPVAVVMRRGWEQVVAVLGAVKAGGAYVPIDASVPPHRIRHLLERCRVNSVLTQPGVLDGFEWPTGVGVLEIPQGLASSGAEVESGRSIRPEDLAYVIFTSGSTGVPKGVMIEHRAASNTVHDVNSRFGIGPEDRVLALSSLDFDLSVYDVFGTLAAGATIVMPAAADAQDPAHWAELARRHGVTVWNSVPALLDSLVQYLEVCPEEVPKTLRLSLLSGDWVPTALPDRARAQFPGLDVVALGGATEASIWSIAFPVERVDPSWKSIPYGRPMANQKFYVLDSALEPCAVGIAGELYIGGVGLARGYWRDNARTEAAFFTHSRTGERLYRTGDLGRYRADGVIEFLGRADSQIKIRGFRVEPGEVESVLAEARGVRRVVVVARNADDGNDKRLVAYIVADSPERPRPRALRSLASERLPAYMVPSAFVFVDSLPLGPNGKLDVRALPSPWGDRGVLDVPYEAPRNDLEEQLAGMWADTLGIPGIGVHDDFFAVGGDSMHAIQVSVRGAREGLRIAPRDIFENTTVATLAEHLGRSSVVPAERGEQSGFAGVGQGGTTRGCRDFSLANLTEEQEQRIRRRFGSSDA